MADTPRRPLPALPEPQLPSPSPVVGQSPGMPDPALAELLRALLGLTVGLGRGAGMPTLPVTALEPSAPTLPTTSQPAEPQAPRSPLFTSSEPRPKPAGPAPTTPEAQQARQQAAELHTTATTAQRLLSKLFLPPTAAAPVEPGVGEVLAKLRRQAEAAGRLLAPVVEQGATPQQPSDNADKATAQRLNAVRAARLRLEALKPILYRLTQDAAHPPTSSPEELAKWSQRLEQQLESISTAAQQAGRVLTNPSEASTPLPAALLSASKPQPLATTSPAAAQPSTSKEESETAAAQQGKTEAPGTPAGDSAAALQPSPFGTIQEPGKPLLPDLVAEPGRQPLTATTAATTEPVAPPTELTASAEPQRQLLPGLVSAAGQQPLPAGRAAQVEEPPSAPPARVPSGTPATGLAPAVLAALSSGKLSDQVETPAESAPPPARAGTSPVPPLLAPASKDLIDRSSAASLGLDTPAPAASDTAAPLPTELLGTPAVPPHGPATVESPVLTVESLASLSPLVQAALGTRALEAPGSPQQPAIATVELSAPRSPAQPLPVPIEPAPLTASLAPTVQAALSTSALPSTTNATTAEATVPVPSVPEETSPGKPAGAGSTPARPLLPGLVSEAGRQALPAFAAPQPGTPTVPEPTAPEPATLTERRAALSRKLLAHQKAKPSLRDAVATQRWQAEQEELYAELNRLQQEATAQQQQAAPAAPQGLGLAPAVQAALVSGTPLAVATTEPRPVVAPPPDEPRPSQPFAVTGAAGGAVLPDWSELLQGEQPKPAAPTEPQPVNASVPTEPQAPFTLPPQEDGQPAGTNAALERAKHRDLGEVSTKPARADSTAPTAAERTATPTPAQPPAAAKPAAAPGVVPASARRRQPDDQQTPGAPVIPPVPAPTEPQPAGVLVPLAATAPTAMPDGRHQLLGKGESAPATAPAPSIEQPHAGSSQRPPTAQEPARPSFATTAGEAEDAAAWSAWRGEQPVERSGAAKVVDAATTQASAPASASPAVTEPGQPRLDLPPLLELLETARPPVTVGDPDTMAPSAAPSPAPRPQPRPRPAPRLELPPLERVGELSEGEAAEPGSQAAYLEKLAGPRAVPVAKEPAARTLPWWGAAEPPTPPQWQSGEHAPTEPAAHGDQPLPWTGTPTEPQPVPLRSTGAPGGRRGSTAAPSEPQRRRPPGAPPEPAPRPQPPITQEPGRRGRHKPVEPQRRRPEQTGGRWTDTTEPHTPLRQMAPPEPSVWRDTGHTTGMFEQAPAQEPGPGFADHLGAGESFWGNVWGFTQGLLGVPDLPSGSDWLSANAQPKERRKVPGFAPYQQPPRAPFDAPPAEPVRGSASGGGAGEVSAPRPVRQLLPDEPGGRKVPSVVTEGHSGRHLPSTGDEVGGIMGGRSGGVGEGVGLLREIVTGIKDLVKEVKEVKQKLSQGGTGQHQGGPGQATRMPGADKVSRRGN